MAAPAHIARENGKKGGRPVGSKAPHTIASEHARKYIVDRVTAELEPILTGQIELAKGLFVEDSEGKVYKKPPDIAAAKNLLDQAYGKAKETVEVESTTRLLLDE